MDLRVLFSVVVAFLVLYILSRIPKKRTLPLPKEDETEEENIQEDEELREYGESTAELDLQDEED